MKKVLTSFVLVLGALSVLSACGVKPNNVKPPEGATGVYPRTYPNPELDADVGPAPIEQPEDQ